MKNVIIAGASGMIGGIVLKECLNSPQIETVTSIVRRPTGVSHPKLTELVHHNFANYGAIKEQFKNKDIAYFCIGVYTRAVSNADFKTITVDYTNAFATLLKELSPQATFCFLSGAGADQKEKSRMSFARFKGIAENHLLRLQFKQLYIFRPGYIYPVEKRAEPNMTYKLMRWIYPGVKSLMTNSAVTSNELGRAIFLTGVNGADNIVLENKDIKKYVAK